MEGEREGDIEGDKNMRNVRNIDNDAHQDYVILIFKVSQSFDFAKKLNIERKRYKSPWIWATTIFFGVRTRGARQLTRDPPMGTSGVLDMG